MNKRFLNAGGFTLVELTVVVAIIVALAAVMVPMVGSAKRDGQVAEILQMVDPLRSASQKYYADTGTVGREYSGSNSTSNHQFSLKQSVPGWNGPYISQALTKGDNPFGGHVYVYNSLNSAYQSGFRLTSGSAGLTARGPGNFVRLTNVPLDIAELVNKALDDGVSGNWRKGGRVTYSGSNLYIFMMDTDGQ
ncbi:MAG: hypothetical protein CMJ83_09235 [Planctomycetes bacterium]|nr:hypothetical protein [Planctomycetota bacterium]